MIHRGDLLAALDRAVTGKVTIISAPPGSGKTTLLRAWADRSRRAHRVAAVSVPRDQEDPQQFWLSLLDAIRQPLDTAAEPRTRTATPGFDGGTLVDTILAELTEQAGSVVLIIDDLHELVSADALTELERLLANLPGSAHAVLSTRRDPRIRLHRLRLAGEVAEIRSAALRFSERETRELLAASGIGLSDAGAAALHQRTEGWAAGLRLAAISLAVHPDPERFVADFSGSDRAVSEYLIAEMLERQPDEVQRVLLRTSLVDRVNGELADLLAGRSGSEGILLELEDANAFVVSLDPQRTWFRYHQLLADFLRLELRRTLPDEVADLHRRAAAWFLEHGYVVDAVRHTQAAGDWSDAARLLADHVFTLVLDGHAGTIDALLRSFPPGVCGDQPELALAYASSRLIQGRLDEAAAQLALAESHLDTVPPARRHRLAVAVAALRLGHARRSLNLTAVIENVDFLASPITGESNAEIALGGELRCVALMNLGIVEMWSGRLADAERHLSEGAALAQRIGRPYLEVVCRAHLGFPSKLRSFAIARERCLEAIALAERHGWDREPVIVPALATLAGTMVWMGEFDGGERWLRRAWEAAGANLVPATRVLLHLATGMLYAARGRHRQALEEFGAADDTQSPLAGEHALAAQVSGWLAATRARLGMPDQARRSLAALPDDRARMGEIRNAWSRILLAEGDAAGALEALRDVLGGTAPVIHAFTLVEAHLLAGRAHLELGDPRAAGAAVETALAVAEADRLILPFAMTESRALLETLPRHRTAHHALLIDILEVLRGASPAPTGENRPMPSEELSRSEVRVLRYLPTNLTRSEIARELHVTVNTVNTHVRNIYSKLGTRDRSAAVRQARELRLLSSVASR
jgi:LuxR family maltose regulon positive regulatory protein